ncbi:unnamed protein product [Didymodactylos carnosus]|uniref:Uncharacterized protein n=1 Tax=Didymodactylos carnosus TaxID=1234261 RepID=A0A8S2K459_9BILA|nr:unnamed protein product [Didymodactylos carnosus]CAF3824954.1 unnamed protein product [Didymodactylos carnosus]
MILQVHILPSIINLSNRTYAISELFDWGYASFNSNYEAPKEDFSIEDYIFNLPSIVTSYIHLSRSHHCIPVAAVVDYYQ